VRSEPRAQYPKSTRKIFRSPNSEPVGPKGNFGALERFRHSPTNESHFLDPFLVILGRFMGYSGTRSSTTARRRLQLLWAVPGVGPGAHGARGAAGEALERLHGPRIRHWRAHEPAPGAAAERAHPRASSPFRALARVVCGLASAAATHARARVGQLALPRRRPARADRTVSRTLHVVIAARARSATTGVTAAWHRPMRKRSGCAVSSVGNSPLIMLSAPMNNFKHEHGGRMPPLCAQLSLRVLVRIKLG
jgi:hypothetical protein